MGPAVRGITGGCCAGGDTAQIRGISPVSDLADSQGAGHGVRHDTHGQVTTNDPPQPGRGQPSYGGCARRQRQENAVVSAGQGAAAVIGRQIVCSERVGRRRS
jgi:hypothetical protein